MASISNDPNGRKRLLFVTPDGKRYAMRLGRMTVADARRYREKVEAIISANIAGASIDNTTAKWVANLPEKHHAKLSAAGLLERRESATLKAFLDGYIDRRSDVEAGTRITYRNTQRCLIGYFGPDKPLRSITMGQAEDWRHWLVSDQKLSDNTVRRRSGVAKQFFRYAAKCKLVDSNPFEDLVSTVLGDPEKFYFVTQDETQKVLDACPDAEWRLIVALSRFGGLRCPSEHLALTWDDIDWANNRITITSKKTKRHPGHAKRVMPLFPVLRPYLDEVYHQAPDGAKHVITRYRDAKQNLRTHFQRIIKRAGLTPWPKLFHNLRATRQTELCDRLPEHVVCAWIGNSPKVAKEHYLRVTDEHFALAQKAAHSLAEVAHFSAQQPMQEARSECNRVQQENAKASENQGSASENAVFSRVSGSPQDLGEVGGTGFEPVASTV